MKIPSQKLPFKKCFRHHALVVFSRPFPIDNLRYDKAFPAYQSDSQEIAESLKWDSYTPSQQDGKTVYVRSDRLAVIIQETTQADAEWSPAVWGSIQDLYFIPISAEDAEELNRTRNHSEPVPEHINQLIQQAKEARALVKSRTESVNA